jgi:uncharacterized OB-fold protein
VSAPNLSAPHVLEYPYRRSVGELMGRFFTGLREGRLLGARGSDGRVLVPPPEFDPVTAERLSELVELAPRGRVTSWCWVREPRRTHPFDRPFAWALVQLDGADVPMLHALDARSESEVRTGMRVRVRWRAERVGEIRDIECFEPGPDELGEASR